MKYLTSIKSKVARMIICSAIIFFSNLIFKFFIPILPISEFGPVSALPPIFGLIFGPWGAAGSALGYLVSDILAGQPPEIYISYFFIQFLYAYIPYKLWYTLDIGKTNSIPRLDTVENLIKFVTIIFINAVVMAGFLGFLMDGLGLYDLFSLTTAVFAFNNFDYSIMFGTLIIFGANLYGISVYKPNITREPLMSPRIFNMIAVLAIVIGVGNVVYSTIAEPDLWSLIAGALSYSLALFFILKPVTREIWEKSSRIKISLTEKLIVVFIITGAIIAIVTGLISYYTITPVLGSQIQFWESVYLNITIILSIYYISSIGFLWYIEKNITTPIESISDITRNYVSDSDGIIDNAIIISKCQQYASQESEVGILARSFGKMIQDLKVYITNLEKVTAEKERINTELDVARKIQSTLLPKRFPPFPDRNEFDIYAMNMPAKKVGGDFYDFFLVDENHLVLVIADVSDKGMPAALFMVIAKTFMKNQALLGKSPKEVFETVNNQLCEGNDENMFVTVWMGLLEISTGKFIYTNAGHTRPLLKHLDKNYKWIKSRPGFILGGMENIKYEQMEITLNLGDKLFLYTDGVTEAINSDEEQFGDLRLQKVIDQVKDPGLQETCNYIQEKIREFANGQEQYDDITMLIMEYKKKSD